MDEIDTEIVVEPSPSQTEIPAKVKRPCSEAKLGALSKARAAKSRYSQERKAAKLQAAVNTKAKADLRSIAEKYKGASSTPAAPPQHLTNIPRQVVESQTATETYIDWKGVGGAILSLAFIVGLNMGKTYFIQWWEKSPTPPQERKGPAKNPFIFG